jgi:hypothetical protein
MAFKPLDVQVWEAGEALVVQSMASLKDQYYVAGSCDFNMLRSRVGKRPPGVRRGGEGDGEGERERGRVLCI